MKLVRVSYTTEAVFGVLLQGVIPFAVTLEDPLLFIPNLTYKCKRVKSPKFGNTFEVTGVEGRTHILFHKGNTEADTTGCILLGEAFNPVLGKPGITQSGRAFEEFLALTAMTNEFPLEVTDRGNV